MDPGGSIPVDNPFFATTIGNHRAIYAYGIRNPFGLATQPETKRIFLTAPITNPAYWTSTALEDFDALRNMRSAGVPILPVMEQWIRSLGPATATK